MTPRKTIQAVLLLGILVIGSFVTFKVAFNQDSKGKTDFGSESPEDNLIDIKGFSVTNFSGSNLVYKIGADEFKISPRRFSIFKIRVYNQAQLINPHIQTYLFTDQDRLKIFPLKQLGTANQVLCDGFKLDIYRNGEHIFNVTAERAKTDLIKKKTSLQKVIITYLPSSEKIASRSVVWDEKAQTFFIPGTYLKETKTDRSLGKGIRIDLLFHQIPNGDLTLGNRNSAELGLH